jgi:hypothetical protein
MYGKIFVYFKKALQDLAICALLHDNALTQYIFEELKNQYKEDEIKKFSNRNTNLHCIYGEKNIKNSV